MRESEDAECPLYLTLDVDIAKSLGGILRDELKIDRDIIAVDGIEVGDLDYIDIGECLGITEVIPVTVKSLMFPTTNERLIIYSLLSKLRAHITVDKAIIRKSR